jgi:hypothetical protein
LAYADLVKAQARLPQQQETVWNLTEGTVGQRNQKIFAQQVHDAPEGTMDNSLCAILAFSLNCRADCYRLKLLHPHRL